MSNLPTLSEKRRALMRELGFFEAISRTRVRIGSIMVSPGKEESKYSLTLLMYSAAYAFNIKNSFCVIEEMFWKKIVIFLKAEV
jgi:hypothetical protein